MKAWWMLPLAAAVAVLVAPAGAQGKKAKCVVSGKEIEVTDQTPRVYVQGKARYFCCENCPKAFARTPEKFLKEVGACPIVGGTITAPKAEERKVINNALWYVCCPGCLDGVASNTVVLKELTDVVSGKKFRAGENSPRVEYRGQLYIFESKETQAAFEKEPAKYAVLYGR